MNTKKDLNFCMTLRACPRKDERTQSGYCVNPLALHEKFPEDIGIYPVPVASNDLLCEV